MNRIPKINSGKFSPENSSNMNQVYLMKVHSEPPFFRPKTGWSIVGWTDQAPWPGPSNGVAVMLEADSTNDEGFSEGIQIWHHIDRERLGELGKIS